MIRVTTVWSGFVGAPGYTNHYFEEATVAEVGAYGAAQAVRQFFTAVAPLMPSTVHLDVQHGLAQINEGTGAQTGEIADITPGPTIVGGDGNPYSAPSGAAVSWGTATFVRGHRLRGRTFLVPLGRQAYDAGGTLADAARTTIQNAANGLATPLVPWTSRLVVWNRPVMIKNPDGTHSVLYSGSYGVVTTYSVKDKSAVLRSRRD